MVYGEIDNDKHWNMSMATLMRMDDCLKDINLCQRQNNYGSDMVNALNTLYHEICVFIDQKKEFVEECQELKSNLVKEYQHYQKMNSKLSSAKFSPELVTSCNQFNRFLRKVMYHYDLYMNKPRDTSEDI